MEQKITRWLIPLTLTLATLNFVRFYVTSTKSYLDLPKYAAGQERMPFQGRMLLMPVLRWAGQSAFLHHFGAVHANAALSQPELTAINLIGLLCLFTTAFLVTRLYRRTSTRQTLPWLPWALLLLICSFNFYPHIEQAVMFPYDLPALLFFTLGLYLIHLRRFWPLALLFPIATLNRETTLFLIPLLAFDEIATDHGLNWPGLLRPSLLARLATLSALWVAVELYVRHRFRANPTEMFSRVTWNLRWALHPNVWPEILSACAFLLPFVLLLRPRIPDARLRAWVLVIPLWLASMFFWGLIIEPRVLGELSALIALAATLIFEETERSERPSGASTRSPARVTK